MNYTKTFADYRSEAEREISNEKVNQFICLATLMAIFMLAVVY